jgi:hypothetical protein
MTQVLWLVCGLLFCCALAIGTDAEAADGEFNYDEAKVPKYTLPDPLKMQDGRTVASSQMWQAERRPELLNLFRTQVYGQPPKVPQNISYEVEESMPAELSGKGLRKDVRILAPGNSGQLVELLKFVLITPRDAKEPVPAFAGILLIEPSLQDLNPGRPLPDDVGVRLPGMKLLETILDRGYAIVSLDPANFCPDDKEKYREGVLEFLYPDRSGDPGAEEPGAIATWAWGLSRALDYLQTDPSIDAKRVAVIGHSRRGKTALWAGAEDERFALVISNDSGCGGAALSRRKFGETVARINRVFPHWFCGNFKHYNDHEDSLPIDQHELVALAAPRPVYVASAVDDGWADPKGEFLAALHSEPVYKLFGLEGLGSSEQPPLNKSVGNTIGYHIRTGKHALTDYDWLFYLDFADKHLKR